MFRRLLDRLHPLFSKGGKLERLFPLYEAGDTFFYTPSDVTTSAPHVRDALDMKRLMSIVVIALVPCFFMAVYNTGYQANLAIAGVTSAANSTVEPYDTWREPVLRWIGAGGHDPESVWDNVAHGAAWFLPVYLVTLAAGGAWEVLFAVVRRHEINEGFFVTSALFPLTLPPAIPLWQVAIGISFGVVIGKEIFGGTGKNFLNPALAGRAYLYFAHSSFITGSEIWTAVDGFTGATPLGAMADKAAIGRTVTDVVGHGWWTEFWGFTQGSMGETSEFCCLIGAVVLIATGIGSWRIMAAVLAGAVAMSSVFWLVKSDTNPMFALSPWWHLVLGGLAFGTVFMATDPVSAAMTTVGQWWYGALIGVMTILIRVLNPGYPEGVMLAILFANVFAPLIDYFVIQANIKRRLARNGA
jgi:Na+-transporting NADH:ubiquinone oxidoreductase subunit B